MPNMNKFSSYGAELTGNAIPEDVAEGKTFYSNDENKKLVGTLPIRAYEPATSMTLWNNKLCLQKIPEGIYKNKGGINQPEVFISSELLGEAQANHVLKGHTFTSKNGINHEGTMPNQGSFRRTINAGGSITIPQGYHDGSGKIETSTIITQAILQSLGFINAPSGKWQLKKGTLATSSLNGTNYIPLTINAQILDTEYNFSYRTLYVKDNNGVNYFQLTHGWDTNQNGNANCRANIYLPIAVGYDCNRLLSIRSFSGAKELTINSWFERIND